MLGELEVWRADRPVQLPQSKKTRALLAYLVLTDREHRRERLCDLLWDVADDRRGALRWSLSKLRTVADDDGVQRIVADRERVAFIGRGARVDALELRRALAGRSVETIETPVLERWAGLFRGELLEGLDLADFDDYQAWCVAEREHARALRIAILDELVKRHAGEAARAAAHARVLVSVDPLNEKARASLVRVLGALGRRDEARQHYEAGRRVESELGRASSGELAGAWREVQERAPTASASSHDVARVPAPPSDPSPPLVGRAREISALIAFAARIARERRACVTLISGEPGAGKTRLVEEWLRRVKARARLYGAAFEAERGHPYGPWVDALRGEAAAAEVVGDVFGGELPSRERLFARVSSVLAELASGADPIAIVLDDVHWLDEGSAELLHYVARTNRERPIAIALAARAGEIADNAVLVRVLRGLRREGLVEELAVGPLDAGEIAALVAPLGVDDGATEVHARSGGNPLFALELARAAAGARSRADDLPPSLAGLVRDRIAQLPEGALEVARWGAVLGASVGVDRIRDVAMIGSDDVVAALEVLDRRAMLRREGDAYAFAHDVVRQVVYADISEPRRRLMHQRVAQLLARTASAADVAEVAHHAALAHDAALAAGACLGAARRSLRVFANADALSLARRGTRQAERLDEPVRTQRLLELAEVTFDARRPDDVDAESKRIEALAERALDLGCPEHARLGFHLVSFLRWERGGWSEAKKHMLQAELVSRGANEAERVRGMAEAARCLVLLERDLGQAEALALEAAARGRQVGEEPSATFDALGMLELHKGRSAEAETELERARALARVQRDHHDEFQALEHLVMLEIARDDRRAALARAEELAQLGERFRDGSEAPFARALVALVNVMLGVSTARADLDRHVEALTLADAKHRLAFVLTRAAWFDAAGLDEDGALERARTRAERALAIARLLERPTELALAHLTLSRCADQRRDAETASAHRRALRVVDLALVAAPIRRLVETALGDEDRREPDAGG